jgi:U32 family peptidase
MKILAPLRSSSEVEPLTDAGAHEFYCGLTPPRWSETQGQSWAHRRNPRSAGVPDEDDLRRIVALASPRPVYVTLNSPSYRGSAIPLLVDFGRRLLEELGVRALIVAESELLLALAEAGLARAVHVSSLATCRNRGAAEFYRELGVSRIILPRHLTLGEIEDIRVPGVELEAFVLNDGCVFEEGLCATTHALGTFCLGDAEPPAQAPTATIPPAEADARPVFTRTVPLPVVQGGGERVAIPAEALERYAFWKWTLNNCGCTTSQGFPLGPCGLCAMPRLASAGVASLKVVGREASLERKEASVRLVAQALRLADDGALPESIRAAAIALRGARGLCEGARLCYYPDVWAGAGPERRAC